MGVVYRALDTRLNRPVAVKVLRDAEGADAARFETEVQMLARFVHPNLVRLLDAGDLDRRPFLVMDLVAGPTLAQRLSVGRLSSAETVTVGSGIAAALAYVHAAGIVHRDIKPANVLLDETGTAHLADFGIARLIDTTGLTATGLTLGTPAYLAPEQVQGGAIGPAADVYALGLVLIECLSGRRAFDGTPSEITAARLQREPELPAELNPAWRALLRSMTTRAPTERVAASDVATALSDSGEFEEAGATLPTAWPSTGPTAVLHGHDTTKTERLDPIEIHDPTLVAPAAGAKPTPRGRRVDRWLGAVLGLLVIGLVLGLTVGGVFSGSKRTPRTVDSPAKSTTTTAAPTSTTSATTSTTILTTTSTPPVPSVASAAGAVVTALETGVTNGSVAPQAGQQLTNQLQPLLFSSHADQPQQQTQQFDQLVAQFDQDVQNGQITGDSTMNALTGSIDNLAAALGTSVPTSTLGNTPGAPGGDGNGHGHGNGN